jgi:hypothetical protein
MIDDELSPELKALFDAERGREGPPGHAKDRVREALAVSLGVAVIGAGAGSGAAAASTAAAGAGKIAGGAAVGGAAAASGAAATSGAVAATATGGALAKGLALALVTAMVGTAGTGVWLASKDGDKKVDSAPVVVEHAPEAPAFDPSVLGRKPEPAPVVEDKPKPALPRPVVPSTPVKVPVVDAAPVESKPLTPEERAQRLAGERTVLDEARAAVARGDGGAALIALEAHRDRYPEGSLVEEREALTVLALVKVGRVDDAKSKADRFRARWPRSLFLPAIDGALTH